MRLSRMGQVVEAAWTALPRHFAGVSLDAYVVMPNHLHGLLVLAEAGAEAGQGEASAGGGGLPFVAGSADASPLRVAGVSGRPRGTRGGSLSAVVQNYKSVSTRRANALRRARGARLWQRNYWEHVVRDAGDLARLRAYIANNPAQWALDELYPGAGGGFDERQGW
jgi:REP element-mobilizing transposase RayT